MKNNILSYIVKAAAIACLLLFLSSSLVLLAKDKHDKLLDESGWMDSVGFKQEKLNIGTCIYLHYTNDGKYLYTFSTDNTFRKWDAETGVVLYEKNFHKKVYDFTLDEANYKYAAISIARSDTVIVYNLETDSILCNIISYNHEVDNGMIIFGTKILIIPNENIIITCFNYLYEVFSGDIRKTIEGYSNFWNILNGNFIQSLYNDKAIISLQNSPDHSNLALSTEYYNSDQFGGSYDSWGNEHLILYNLFDTTKNKQLYSNNSYKDALLEMYNTFVKFSHNSHYLLFHESKYIYDNFRLYDLETDSMLYLIRMQKPFDFQFSMNDSFLISGHYIITDNYKGDTLRSVIYFRGPTTGRIIDSLNLNKVSYAGLFIASPDSTSILMGGIDGYLRLFKIPEKTLSVKDKPLLQNLVSLHAFPNPFSSSITIEYTLPEPSPVKISLYDVFGNEVAVIDRNEYQQGLHRVEYSGSNLTQGMYYLRVQAGTFISTEKVMYMK